MDPPRQRGKGNYCSQLGDGTHPCRQEDQCQTGLLAPPSSYEQGPAINCQALNERLAYIKRLTDLEAIGQLSTETVGFVFVIGSIIQLHWP